MRRYREESFMPKPLGIDPILGRKRRRGENIKYPSRTNPDLFWEKVEKKQPTECWIWKGYCPKPGHPRYGYGVIKVAGKAWRAHRYAYSISKGPIPPGTQVCHSCDNPPCCNPEHLWLGTAFDNMRDMVRKGRHVPRLGATPYHNQVRGESCHNAKLTEAIVRAIRLDQRGAGVIAKDLGVSWDAIDRIRKGKTWRHIL
jgi:hypothetical protein